MNAIWEQLVSAICRPPRDEFSTADLIGGTSGKFHIYGKEYLRKDFKLTNKKNLKLECSHFVPKADAETPLPCVIYCHCNSGSRRDAEEAVYILLPHNITVFTLDFAGSGRSEGEYVTLGAHEVEDVAVVVDHLRAENKASTIGIWGRSMGAVTALLYSQRDPSIAGVVLDSPFSKLTDLMLELVEEQKLPVPRAFMRLALSWMRKSVRKRAGFDINAVNPLEVVPQAFIPAVFGHADGDTFIAKHHSERLHAAYAGEKELLSFDGDHNSHRPQFFYISVLRFFNNVLQCTERLDVPPPRDPRLEHDLGSTEVRRRRHQKEAGRAAGSRDEHLPDFEAPPAWHGSEEELSAMWEELAASNDNGYGSDAGSKEQEGSRRTGSSRSRHDVNESRSSRSQRSIAGEARSNSRLAATSAMRDSTAAGERSTLDDAAEAAGLSQLLLDREEAELAQALELSLLETAAASKQQQPATSERGTGDRGRNAEPGSADAALHALDHLLPDQLRGLDPRMQEEAMLAQAIAASLAEVSGQEGDPNNSSSPDSKPSSGPPVMALSPTHDLPSLLDGKCSVVAPAKPGKHFQAALLSEAQALPPEAAAALDPFQQPWAPSSEHGALQGHAMQAPAGMAEKQPHAKPHARGLSGAAEKLAKAAEGSGRNSEQPAAAATEAAFRDNSEPRGMGQLQLTEEQARCKVVKEEHDSTHEGTSDTR